MVVRLLLIALSLPVLAGGAWGMPRGTVLIRGLRKELSSVEWEVVGQQVKVKTSRGVRWFELDEVELIPDVDSVDRAAPPALKPAEHARLQRRLVLVPPEGWRPVGFQQPLLAEAYKHPSQEAYLELWITPAGDYRFPSAPSRSVDTAVLRDASAAMSLRYASAQRPQFSWVEVAGKTLLHGKVAVEVFGSDERWEVEELRLRHGDLEFAIALRTQDKLKLSGATSEELLRRFSFLPPVEESEDRYVDHELGFYLLAPRGPWTLLARPFARTEPLHVTRGSGEAELTVEVLQSGTPQGIADTVVADHKKQNSGFLEVKAVERSTRDGQEVVFYRLDDYPVGKRELHTFMGIALRTPAGRLLHFRGVAAVGDGAAPEELKLMLSGVRFLDGDKGGLDEDLEAAKAASEAQERMKVKDYAGAISALDRCLDIYPAYVPAILFRAEAKKASADFTGYREDLALAQEYDPSVEGANGPEAYAEEAKLAEAARDYEQACRSWATAYDKSSDAAYLKSFSRALNSYWTELKKDKEESYERKVRALEDAAEIQNLDREDEVKKVLASVYTSAANQAKAEKDYSKAFRYASKLKSLRGDYRDQGDKLRDQIKAAKDRDRK